MQITATKKKKKKKKRIMSYFNDKLLSSNYRERVTHLAEFLDFQTPFADDASRLTLVHQHAHVNLVAAMAGTILKSCLQ